MPLSSGSRAMVRAVFALLVIAGVSSLLGACGGASVASHSAVPAAQVSAASCAGLSPAKQVADARVVIVGKMLPGVTLSYGNQRVLASPARVRVLRYLKGRGPKSVRVETAVTRMPGGIQTAEDGITPAAGQLWKIYSASKRSPYQTATCAGSQEISRPH
jgi:hypothetical protein